MNMSSRQTQSHPAPGFRSMQNKKWNKQAAAANMDSSAIKGLLQWATELDDSPVEKPTNTFRGFSALAAHGNLGNNQPTGAAKQQQSTSESNRFASEYANQFGEHHQNAIIKDLYDILLSRMPANHNQRYQRPVDSRNENRTMSTEEEDYEGSVEIITQNNRSRNSIRSATDRESNSSNKRGSVQFQEPNNSKQQQPAGNRRSSLADSLTSATGTAAKIDQNQIREAQIAELQRLISQRRKLLHEIEVIENDIQNGVTQESRVEREKRIKKFTQNTRELANSAFLTYFGRTPFAAYGNANTTDKNSGFITSNYLKSHNLNPHRGDTQPEFEQTYPNAFILLDPEETLVPKPPRNRIEGIPTKKELAFYRKTNPNFPKPNETVNEMFRKSKGMNVKPVKRAGKTSIHSTGSARISIQGEVKSAQVKKLSVDSSPQSNGNNAGKVYGQSSQQQQQSQQNKLLDVSSPKRSSLKNSNGTAVIERYHQTQSLQQKQQQQQSKQSSQSDFIDQFAAAAAFANAGGQQYRKRSDMIIEEELGENNPTEQSVQKFKNQATLARYDVTKYLGNSKRRLDGTGTQARERQEENLDGNYNYIMLMKQCNRIDSGFGGENIWHESDLNPQCYRNTLRNNWMKDIPSAGKKATHQCDFHALLAHEVM